MSEYQYYEFRAIDRPLTAEEQETIGKLSSRVDLSPTHASFVYNYSDLPANAEELLARYFDAMFYIANWGSCQLMFRFPKAAVELEQIQPYFQPPFVVEKFASLTEQGGYVVLNIKWYEEAPDWGWIEGEGWLPRLMSLRDEILRADYRLLYLAWLKAMTLEEVLDTVEEPPVPPGLRQLSSGLKTFIELFELDEYLVAAAAEASGSPRLARPNSARLSTGFRPRRRQRGCCGWPRAENRSFRLPSSENYSSCSTGLNRSSRPAVRLATCGPPPSASPKKFKPNAPPRPGPGI